jgi:hypothetical protein
VFACLQSFRLNLTDKMLSQAEMPLEKEPPVFVAK